MVGGGQIFLILIVLVIFALWIKTIIEIANSTFTDNNKTIWLLVVILVGWIGMIIYYAAGRSQRIIKQDNSSDVIDDF
ncbi:MAG: putative membrane protein [Crocinitomix sp.]|jgi:uncharacterized membrane protein